MLSAISSKRSRLRVAERLALILAVIVFAVTVGRFGTNDKTLEVGNVTYTFPRDHVFRFTNPGEGHPFARLRPRGLGFDLIYSDFLKYKRNWQGQNVPKVAGINDFPADRFWEFSYPGGKTVCRMGGLFYTCGLRLRDAGVDWSIVFNADALPKSEAIRAAATKALREYRQARS